MCTPTVEFLDTLDNTRNSLYITRSKLSFLFSCVYCLLTILHIFKETGKIDDFVEKPKEVVSNKINAGLYIFKPSILDRYSIYKLWDV